MVEASRARADQGPAWKKVRLEVLALCALMALAGMLLVLIPWPQGYGQFPRALGMGLILAGAIVVASRPWNFMRRMESQLLAHKERLRAQMTEVRRLEDTELDEMKRKGDI